jgi:hypothetical protein
MVPERLNIKPTKRSPRVLFEPGRLFVMGRSIIENPSIFYEPVLKWISGMADCWPANAKIDLGFEYVNSGSTKWLYILLRQLGEIREFTASGDVNWYYEKGDNDMCELGYMLKSLIECPFRIIEMNELNEENYENILKGNI